MPPRASSIPRISVKTTGSSTSSNKTPIATPATEVVRGTPASNNAKHPPQTDAIDELPHDSVIKDSTLIL